MDSPAAEPRLSFQGRLQQLCGINLPAAELKQDDMPDVLLHDMHLSALCSLNVLAIAGKQTIRNAARLLWERSCTSASNMQHDCAC